MMNIRQIRTTVSYQTHFLCTNTKIPKWNGGDGGPGRQRPPHRGDARGGQACGARRPRARRRGWSAEPRRRRGAREAPRALLSSAVHFTCSPFAAKTWKSLPAPFPPIRLLPVSRLSAKPRISSGTEPTLLHEIHYKMPLIF